MSKNEFLSREKGQILVILVLALVGLLAFTALAIDVGMAYSDRRYDQNVADAAALTGAQMVVQAMKTQSSNGGEVKWDDWANGSTACTGWSEGDSWNDAPSWLQIGQKISYVHVFNAAIGRAATNNMTIGLLSADNPDNGVAIRCLTGERDKFIEVKVLVSTTINTSFAHIFFGGTMRNTVTAIARVSTKTPYGYGNAILALNTNCQGNTGGMEFDGGVIVNSFNGGDIFTNQCMETHAGSATINIFDGLESTTCDLDATIGYLDDHVLPINAEICPEMKRFYEPIDEPDLPLATCAGLPTKNGRNIKDGDILDPGIWDSISVSRNDINVTLKPGLYCITGGLKFTGGNFTVNWYDPNNPTISDPSCEDEHSPAECGVTFYLMDGDFSLAGNGAMVLAAPMDDDDTIKIDSPTHAHNGAIPNMLIEADDDYTGQVDIEGTQNDIFIGTIFVPKGDLIIGGNSTVNEPACETCGPTFSSLIADRIKFHGDTAVNVIYDKDHDFYKNAYLEMEK